MHAVDLIANALETEQIQVSPQPQGVCCVTGATCAVLPRRELFGRSFVDQGLMRAPASRGVGINAWKALRHVPERKANWWCDGHVFRTLSRTEARQLVLDGVEAPRWCGYITTSYKKHGALRAPVNTAGSQRWLFETRVVDCGDRATVRSLFQRMMDLRKVGATREHLATLDVPPSVLRRLGIARWMDFSYTVRQHQDSGLYALLLHLLPTQQELREKP